MKTLIMAATGLAAFVSPQFAAAQSTFSGPRLQAVAGYDRLEANDDYYDLPQKFENAFVGAAAGYDQQIAKNVVIGAEVSFAKPLGDYQSVTLGGDTISLKAGREWAANVRVGTPVTDRTLLFATLGYSNASLKAIYESPGTPTGDRTTFKDSEGGLMWGIGVEQSIGKRAFTSLAFRSAKYGDYNYGHGIKRSQIRLGAGIRF